MKRILTTLSQKWPEYLLEMIVITAGIIGAFALNNWNERSISLNKEKLLLKAVHEEFTENRIQFQEVIQSHRGVFASTTWILDHMPYDQKSNMDSVDMHFWGTFKTLTFNPSSSSIKSIISTGSLDVVRNEELRNLIVKWEDELLDYQEEETLARNFHWGEYFSEWRSMIDLDLFGNSPLDYQVLNTRIAKNLILQRSYHFKVILGDGELEAIEGTMDRIIELTAEKAEK